MLARRLEYIPLDEIVPATRNPKRHADEDLLLSIRRHGFTMPLLQDGRTGKLIAGHGRLNALMALRDAGDDPPDGITDDWRVPVVVGWASPNEGEANAALVGDNQIPPKGGWDNSELFALLDSLDDLDGTGFNLDDLDALGKSLYTGDDDDKKTGNSSRFDVVVHCRDLEHQQQVVESLRAEGLDADAK